MNYKIDRDTVVLILGGTGSVGSMLVEKFLALDVKKIKVIARDESKQSELIVNNNSDKIEPIIGDIRDIDSMEDAMKGVDVVVNAAAMKHVWYCENFPEEAYKTNVLGTINLVRLCKRMKIKKLILISSDKVVNPTTAYGASKLMAERVILAAHKRDQSNDFNIVRFGNVIGSRNSVLDLVSKAINTNNGNIQEDGKFGPHTLDAINNVDSDALLTSYKKALCSYYRSIVIRNPKDEIFLKGWLARANS